MVPQNLKTPSEIMMGFVCLLGSLKQVNNISDNRSYLIRGKPVGRAAVFETMQQVRREIHPIHIKFINLQI